MLLWQRISAYLRKCPKVHYGEDEAVFDDNDEKVILQKFSDYVQEKNPDIIVSLGDYDDGKLLGYLYDRAGKIGFDLQLGKVYISSSYRKRTYFDQFGFAGLIERARFSFIPLDKAAKYSINRLIDSRNCFELIQKNFVIPSRARGIENYEHIRTVEQIVSGDKGGMVISPQIGLHEDVLALDYDNEYANLIVKHNLSYETVGGEAKKLLPTVVERFLKRRLYFKRLLKEFPKDSQEYLWCEQRVNSLKNILVCLYGSTGSLWNRFGNVITFEEINRLSREVLLKTKDIVQGLGYDLVYADTDSVFIKRTDSALDYNQLIDTLSMQTGLSISVDYHYKFLVLLPLEADEKIEVLNTTLELLLITS